MQTLSNLPGTASAPAMGRKIYLFDLCRERLFLTDPGGGKTYDVGPQGGLEIGAYVEDLQVRISGVNFSANFRYKIVGGYSNDGGTSWNTFSANILGDTVTIGNVNSNAYTTRSDFGLLLRFQVVVSNATGGGVESGTLSVTLAVKVWS